MRGSYNQGNRHISPLDRFKFQFNTTTKLKNLTREMRQKIEAIEMRYIAQTGNIENNLILAKDRKYKQKVSPAYIQPPSSNKKKLSPRRSLENAKKKVSSNNFDFSLIALLKNQRMMRRRRKTMKERKPNRNYFGYKNEENIAILDDIGNKKGDSDSGLGRVSLSKVKKAKRDDKKKLFLDKNGKIIEYVVEKNDAKKYDYSSELQQNEAIQKEFMIISGQALKKNQKIMQKNFVQKKYFKQTQKTVYSRPPLVPGQKTQRRPPTATKKKFSKTLNEIETKKVSMEEKFDDEDDENFTKTRENLKPKYPGPRRRLRQGKHKRRLSFKDSPYIEINTKKIKLPTTKQFSPSDQANLQQKKNGERKDSRPKKRQKSGLRNEWDELAMYSDNNMTYIRKPVTYEKLLIDNRRKKREYDTDSFVDNNAKIVRNAWI